MICGNERPPHSVARADTAASLSTTRDEGLDKFYTVPAYSKKCIDKVFSLYNVNDFDLVVEPSAGAGSFYNQIPTDKKIGIDISPGIAEGAIIKQDFFDYRPAEGAARQRILVIGNPPFGKVSSLAIRFFNHAAEWCDIIAFIIPRTFRRPSVQNKLNPAFHLVYDEDVPTKPCCFTPKMAVKCCFQIWERRAEAPPRRIVELPTKHLDWEFIGFGPTDHRGQPTPPPDGAADFAIRAYGGRIGEIKKGADVLRTLRPKSWHWIKSNRHLDARELADRFAKLDYSESTNTARQNSMGRGELVRLYAAAFGSSAFSTGGGGGAGSEGADQIDI